MLNTIIGIAITFVVLVASLFVGLNTVIFMGELIFLELYDKYKGVQNPPLEISDVDWMQSLTYQSNYWYIYVGVGIYAGLKFTSYTYTTLQKTLLQITENRRKAKEESLARKANHERKMLEYKSQANVDAVDEQKYIEYYEVDEEDYSVPSREKGTGTQSSVRGEPESSSAKSQPKMPPKRKPKIRSREEIIADTQGSMVSDEPKSMGLVIIEDEDEDVDSVLSNLPQEDNEAEYDVVDKIISQESSPTRAPKRENSQKSRPKPKPKKVPEYEYEPEPELDEEENDVDIFVTNSRKEEPTPPRKRERIRKNKQEPEYEPEQDNGEEEADSTSSIPNEQPKRKTVLEIQKERKRLIELEKRNREKREAEEVARAERERNQRIRERNQKLSENTNSEDFDLKIKGLGNQD